MSCMVKPVEVRKSRQTKGPQDSEGHSDAHEERTGKGEVETVPLNLQEKNPFCQCLWFCRVGHFLDFWPPVCKVINAGCFNVANFDSNGKLMLYHTGRPWALWRISLD